jgi:hypothetical protein
LERGLWLPDVLHYRPMRSRAREMAWQSGCVK